MNPQEPSSPQRVNPPRRQVGILAVLGLIVIVSVIGLKAHAQLKGLRAREAALTQQASLAAAQVSTLQQRQATLSQELEHVSADRNNLLSQIHGSFEDREHALADRALLEQVFKRAEAQRLALLSRVTPLETQLLELQQEQTRLSTERSQLERQLAKAKDRSQEQTLRGELAKVHRDQTDLRRVLRKATHESKVATRREERAAAHLKTLAQRVDTLHKEYTDEVSQNAMLRRRVNRLPKDVTSMAREHERLLKELADTHFNMAVMFTRKRDYGRAAKEFQQVVELAPDDAEAYYNLGVIYAEHLPNRDKAISFFRKYLVLNPRGQDASWAKQYLATWQAWEGKERLE